ncbi:hypothetical protein D3C80_2167510 [compost metagenome]
MDTPRVQVSRQLRAWGEDSHDGPDSELGVNEQRLKTDAGTRRILEDRNVVYVECEQPILRE